MNKREAEAIARDITRHGLTVTGYRRCDYGKRGASWAVDVQDTTTGYTFTVDEPGQWHERQSQYGNLAADDKPAGRPTTYGQTMLKRTVLMPPAMWEWVEATGAGNVSVGIRQAVQAAMEAPPSNLSSMTVEQLHELRDAISKELRETYRASSTRTRDGKQVQEATR